MDSGSSDEEEPLRRLETPWELVLTGVVRKMKNLLMYNTRQLLLYSDGVLEYYDP